VYGFSTPCRCVDNILITYDENKAKADIPTNSLNNIYMRHKYNTTAAYKKIFFYILNWKSLSHIIRTLKKNSSTPVPVMLSTQSTIKLKLRKK